MRSNLTKPERVKLFAAKYVEFGFNGSRVMREVFKCPAGQENRRASEYLCDPEVQAEIARICAKRIANAEWTVDDVLRRIRRQYVKANKNANGKNALMALRMYGQHLKMFGDKAGEGEGFDPLVIYMPGANQTIMVNNGGQLASGHTAPAPHGAVQDLRVLQPEAGQERDDSGGGV